MEKYDVFHLIYKTNKKLNKMLNLLQQPAQTQQLLGGRPNRSGFVCFFNK